MKLSTLTPDALRQIDAYWRAANYLSVGQIFSATIRCCSGRRRSRM
jgi:phosphoketolase